MAVAAVARPFPTVFQPATPPGVPLLRHSNSPAPAHFLNSDPPSASGDSWFHLSGSHESHASSQTSASAHSHLPKGARPASPQVNPLVQEAHTSASNDSGLSRSKSQSSWKLEWRGVSKVVKWAFPRNKVSIESASGKGKSVAVSAVGPGSNPDRTMSYAGAGGANTAGPWETRACDREVVGYGHEEREVHNASTLRRPIASTNRATSVAVATVPRSWSKSKAKAKFFISPSTSTTFVDHVYEFDGSPACYSRSELGHGSEEPSTGMLRRRGSMAATEHVNDFYSIKQRARSEIGHVHAQGDLEDSRFSRCTFSDQDHEHSSYPYRPDSASVSMLMPSQSYSDVGHDSHLPDYTMLHPFYLDHSPSSFALALGQDSSQPKSTWSRSLPKSKRNSLSYRSATNPSLNERPPPSALPGSAPRNPTPRSPRKLQKTARSATLPHMRDAHGLHHHLPRPDSLPPPPPLPATLPSERLHAQTPRKPFLHSLSNLNLVITPKTPSKTPRKLQKRSSPVSPTASRKEDWKRDESTLTPSQAPAPPASAEKPVQRTPSRSASILRSRLASAFIRRSSTPDAESSESSGSSSSDQRTPSDESPTPDMHIHALEHEEHGQDNDLSVPYATMLNSETQKQAPIKRPSILRTESNRRWTVAAADVPDDLFIEELERLRRMGLRAVEIHGARGSGDGGRAAAAASLEANTDTNGNLDIDSGADANEESSGNAFGLGNTRPEADFDSGDSAKKAATAAVRTNVDLEAEMKEELDWLHARRAILTCRELVRTEKTYQQRLQELADGSVSDAVPSLLLQYLPALIGASKILSFRFLDDMSTLGIADAFPAVITALEAAFVPWSGVVGEFFKGSRESSYEGLSPKRKRKSTLTGILTEEDMPTDFGAVKVRCLSMHGLDKSQSRRSSTHIAGMGQDVTMTSWAPQASSRAQWLTRPPPFTAEPLDISDQTNSHSSSKDKDAFAFATLKKSLSRRESRIRSKESKEEREREEKERRRLPSFRDLAILPTQRVTRYVLLFQDLLKHTPRSSPSYAVVQRAVDAAVRLAQKCDRAQGNSAFLHPV